MSNIIAFLQKSFQSLESGTILPMGIIAHELVKCAKANTYVETLGNHADTLHSWIKKGYEIDFKLAFEHVVRKVIRRLCISSAHIAVDFTSEPFYGKSVSLYLFNVEDEKWSAEFKYIVVSLITRNKQIPLMALPVRVGEGIARPTIQVLEYTMSLFKQVRFATFDRSFYCAEVIDYLEANNIKYLILVPEKKGKISEYVEQTDTLGKFRHEMKYSKDKSTWRPTTTIVVCKGIDEYPWIFATNIRFYTRVEYIWWYKRRWQIETNFWVQDEARIKSKSCHHLIRFFYFLISLLLHLLWIGHKNVKYYVPFKKYVDMIEILLFQEFIGVMRIQT